MGSSRVTKSEVEKLGNNVAIKLNTVLSGYQSQANCPGYMRDLHYCYNTEYGLFTQYANSSGIGNIVDNTSGVNKVAYETLYIINRTLEFTYGLMTGQAGGLL